MGFVTAHGRELFPRVRSNRPALAASGLQRRSRSFIRSIPVAMTSSIAVGLRSVLGAPEPALDGGLGPLRRSRDETISRLARMAALRHKVTGQHTERMSAYCYVLALELGLSRDRAKLIRSASTLHDIGKVAIPDRILLKPGPLTAAETAVMQTHAEIGSELLAGAAQPLDVAARIALTHHEHYDGGGYPRGLVGSDIPIEGRIAAVADVFDALTSRRPYRAADPVDVAVGKIEAGSGSQFDPVVVGAFLTSLGQILEIRERYTRREAAPHPSRSRRNTPFASQI